MNSSQLCRWIDDVLSREPPGTQLPFARELARRFGLSESTVNRALARFVAQGRIERIAGKGTFVACRSGGEEPVELHPFVRSRQLVVRGIIGAISRGELKRGNVLPPIKVLSAQSRVSKTTVRLALRELEQRGMLSRFGRHYRIGGLTGSLRRPGRNRIVLLSPHPEATKALFTSVPTRRVYVRMQEELADAGFALEHYLYTDIAALARAWNRSSSWPHGIVLTGARQGALSESDLGQVLKPVRSSLSRCTTKPRVVALLRGRAGRVPGVLIYNTGHHVVTVARTLARHVVVKGFSEVRCFFDETRRPIAEAINIVNLFPEIDALSRDIEVSFRVRGVEPATRDGFLERFGRRFRPEYIDSVLSKHRPITRSALESRIHVGASIEDLPEPPGSNALWITDDDETAGKLLGWCVSRRVKVPRDVSLVTLENSPRHYHRNLSACEPDFRTDGYLMAHALLGDIPIARTHHGYIPTTARLTERCTTTP